MNLLTVYIEKLGSFVCLYSYGFCHRHWLSLV